jgi:hypothetical protein
MWDKWFDWLSWFPGGCWNLASKTKVSGKKANQTICLTFYSVLPIIFFSVKTLFKSSLKYLNSGPLWQNQKNSIFKDIFKIFIKKIPSENWVTSSCRFWQILPYFGEKKWWKSTEICQIQNKHSKFIGQREKNLSKSSNNDGKYSNFR